MTHSHFQRNRTYRLSTPVRLGVVAVAACFLAAPVLSNPVNPTVVNGTATFTQAGTVLTVTNSNGAIIQWDKFSIAAGEKTHFAQSSASSSVLNRVLNDPSAIYGTLSSNGRVWLINPAGIMVGASGRIDTAAFVASTLNIRNEDFLAGRNLFINDGTGKDVINQGEIITPAGGSVYLIGSNVANEGIITTPKGETILAAGATVSLIDSALPGVKVDITGATGNATNLGTITAEAGRIGIAGVIVKNSGTLNASSVVNDGGRIFLKASQDAYVDGNGRIVTTGTKGGSVEVLGNRVAVMDHASIDASATSEGGDGGRILVGGDYQGKNPDIQNANITYFGPDATLKADAGKVGDGGTVIVWADDTTRAYGNISARGGASGGKGGFVETSGKRYLDVAGAHVDTRAADGSAGMWLLDPSDITIISGAYGGSSNFAPTVTGSTILDGDINDALSFSNLTITTSSVSGGNGDITFDSSAAAIVVSSPVAGPRTLTLDANHDIIFSGANGTTFKTPASVGTLDVYLNTPTGTVKTLAGSSVKLDGDAGGPNGLARAWLLAGRTWDNYGTLNIKDNAAVHLGSGSTLHNKSTGIVNVDGGAGGFAFFSSASDDGIISNDGMFNVTVGGAFEAAYSQSASGTLNIANVSLNLQNVNDVSGTVGLNATGALNFTESHLPYVMLHDLAFTGTGGSLTINSSGQGNSQEVRMTNVSAPNVALTVGGGGLADQIKIQNGDAVFKTIVFGAGGTLGGIDSGRLAVTGGGIGLNSGFNGTGNSSLVAYGGITFVAGTYNFGVLNLVTGWDGSSSLTAPVTPNAGNISIPTSVFMYATDVSMRTGTGGISQASGGLITASSLSATSYGSGAVGFGGNNKIDYVTLYSAGDLNYNSYKSFHLVKATASTGSGVAITTVSGSPYGGNVYVGEISSGTSATISAYGGIYDDNGNGVANITVATSASLTSFGGTAGNLAISADVKSGTATNATVLVGSTYGGIRIWAIDNMPSGNMNLTDGASYQPSIGFYYAGSIANPGIVNLSAGASGSLVFAAGGNMTGAPNVLSAPVSGGLILAAGGTLSLPSAFGSPSYGIGLLGSSVVVDGAILGKTLTVGAGSLTIGSTGGLAAVGALVGVVVNDVNINGGYMRSGTGDLELLVGGNLNIGNASYGGAIWAGYGQSVPYFPDASIAVGGSLKLNNGAYIKAANDVYLDLMGSASTLVLNDGTVGYAPSYVMSDIGTLIPATTHLSFLGRSSGGVIINGIETTTTVVGGSGFFAVNSSTPATAGAGLQVTYSATNQDLCAISPDLCNPKPPADSPIDEPPPTFEITGPGGTQPGGTPGQTAGGTEGSFGGEENGDDKKKDDKDKDKKSDQAKDEKKDDKPGQKKVAQCS